MALSLPPLTVHEGYWLPILLYLNARPMGRAITPEFYDHAAVSRGDCIFYPRGRLLPVPA
jgi:hypothetical protein